MAKDDSSQITTKLGDKKWILGCLGLVLLFTIVLILAIFWVGTESANPWGEAPGPGH